RYGILIGNHEEKAVPRRLFRHGAHRRAQRRDRSVAADRATREQELLKVLSRTSASDFEEPVAIDWLQPERRPPIPFWPSADGGRKREEFGDGHLVFRFAPENRRKGTSPAGYARRKSASSIPACLSIARSVP